MAAAAPVASGSAKSPFIQPPACMVVSPSTSPRSTAKTDGWSGYPGAAGVNHDPHVVGNMASYIVLPWVCRSFPNLKVWGLDLHHGLRREHFQSDLDEFVFGAPGMPHSDPCWASPLRTGPCLTRY
jgi:hypothetical protein